MGSLLPPTCPPSTAPRLKSSQGARDGDLDFESAPDLGSTCFCRYIMEQFVGEMVA